MLEQTTIKVGTGEIHVEKLHQGDIFDVTEGMYPSKLIGYTGEGVLKVGAKTSTTYGYVQSGTVKIKGQKEWELETGYYFSFNEEIEVSGNGSAVFYERYGFNGPFNIGGPVEKRGRLAYIDGCSDSLLVYPPRLGDPCLNLLVFPKNIHQTMHIHPSVRLGLVIEGKGVCITPEETIDLVEGSVFCLDEMKQHCFHTDENNHMKIVAYHPDSDWGPSDENHPMLNRTFIQK
ncbi:TPA: hypothetical protein QC448_004594 [Bacillus cereus]|uniref:hypothetical protein n=1 Tax=Bacillus TaxID=1386 RepID=UPI000BF3711B|nr:hypothetical protein [Bacillus thuringiensis]PFU70398.1 hypothetical protein COK95_09890 [Bacillus thuringiensis]RAS90258.1 hypothetical protein A6E21_26125 [Bacillus cereus]HDR8128707.1 hypothetical protein [Bacillus cereus]HDR8493502.1 hypothetical protein [Bacillus cereus]